MKVKMKLEWVVELDEEFACSLDEIEDNFETSELTREFCGQGESIYDLKCTAVRLEDCDA